jgi:hypothetical protein
MTLCASLILSSGLRTRPSMRESELVGWVQSLPNHDEWLGRLPSALETLQHLGVVEVRRDPDHVAYALSPSARQYVRWLNETAKKQSMGVIGEYLDTLAPSVSGSRTSAS